MASLFKSTIFQGLIYRRSSATLSFVMPLLANTFRRHHRYDLEKVKNEAFISRNQGMVQVLVVEKACGNHLMKSHLKKD